MRKIDDAKMLLGGAKSFFHGLHHRPDPVDEEGLGEEDFGDDDWSQEGKDVWMFSGCKDDQTSADASISGSATGLLTPSLLNPFSSERLIGQLRCHVMGISERRQGEPSAELY